MITTIEHLIQKSILVWTEANVLEPKENNLLLIGGEIVEAVEDFLVGWHIKTGEHAFYPIAKEKEIGEVEVYLKLGSLI